MTEIVVERAGVELSGDETGEGVPVVLLHGLTATRRYVVMGSKHARAIGPSCGRLRRSGSRPVLAGAFAL